MSNLLEVYQQQVDDLATEGKSFRISNRNVEHAAVLLEAILKTAEQEVRIFCGNLSESFYGQERLKSALINYLHKPGSRLQILAEERLSRNHAVLQALQPYIDNKVEVRCIKLPKKISHFAVLDRRGYRFEFTHHEPNPAVVEAVANFNEPEIASKLADQFDTLFSTAESVV